MKLTDFAALSFDCYGTLIDWEAGLSAVLVSWARGRGLDLTEEQLLTAYAPVEAAVEQAHPTDLYRDVLGRTMRLLGDKLGVEVTDADAARLATSVPDWPAFPDSADALARLAKHYQLIILSNVDRNSFAGATRRLDVTFAGIVTAQDVGSYKPSRRNFDALKAEAARLGVREGKLLHVAQSLYHDHVPARQVGLPGVWINRRQDRPGWGATPAPPADVRPDWEFPSMRAFAEAVTAEAVDA